MLTFIGNGSAFNTELGNNSAYYKEGNQMLLIDCGSNIFERIRRYNLLEGVEHIHVVITHTHADHVGSLADLILYMYYAHGEFAKPKVTVYSGYGVSVSRLLLVNGITQGTYYKHVSTPRAQIVQVLPNISFNFFDTPHVTELVSYGLDMTIGDKRVYYSGDTSSISETHLQSLSGYDYFYIDTCEAHYEGNVHLSLQNLETLIDPEYRHKVWCMHLDTLTLIPKAKEKGFRVTRSLTTPTHLI